MTGSNGNDDTVLVRYDRNIFATRSETHPQAQTVKMLMEARLTPFGFSVSFLGRWKCGLTRSSHLAHIQTNSTASAISSLLGLILVPELLFVLPTPYQSPLLIYAHQRQAGVDITQRSRVRDQVLDCSPPNFVHFPLYHAVRRRPLPFYIRIQSSQ
jgi:hypothetical protein